MCPQGWSPPFNKLLTSDYWDWQTRSFTAGNGAQEPVFGYVWIYMCVCVCPNAPHPGTMAWPCAIKMPFQDRMKSIYYLQPFNICISHLAFIDRTTESNKGTVADVYRLGEIVYSVICRCVNITEMTCHHSTKTSSGMHHYIPAITIAHGQSHFRYA